MSVLSAPLILQHIEEERGEGVGVRKPEEKKKKIFMILFLMMCNFLIGCF